MISNGGGSATAASSRKNSSTNDNDENDAFLPSSSHRHPSQHSSTTATNSSSIMLCKQRVLIVLSLLGLLSWMDRLVFHFDAPRFSSLSSCSSGSSGFASVAIKPGSSHHSATTMGIQCTQFPCPSSNTYRVPKADRPAIMWFLTFPNSGTTYTLNMIQQYTNTTTATNYGDEASFDTGVFVPVKDRQEDEVGGPWWRHPDSMKRPAQWALTKTHAGGTALSTTPVNYLETTRSFELACRSTTHYVYDDEDDDPSTNSNNTDAVQTNQTNSSIVPEKKKKKPQHISRPYPSSLVHGAIHLIRNPIDNIVARHHYEHKKWTRHNDSLKLDAYPRTVDGFQHWCRDRDETAHPKEVKSRFLDAELMTLLDGLPCRSEFLRYVWWHNAAIDVVHHRLQLPVIHYLWYENYTGNAWEETISDLLQVLELTPASAEIEPLPFTPGSHYPDFLTEAQTSQLKRLLQALASPETWRLIEHYF